MLRRAVLLGALVAVATAAPAAAFAPPVLYVRPTFANSTDHAPQGDWIPLSSAPAPALSWLGGYDIGYAIQEAGTPYERQHVAIQVTGVPDGQPTQPHDATPFCTGAIGAVGDIFPIPFALQFEGDGTYTVKVSVGPSSGGETDCMTPGASTASATGSFTVGVTAAPQVVGQPHVFRATPLSGDAFVGVRSPAAPGGDAETRCALDATVGADGSVSGAVVAPAADAGASAEIGESDFPRPGAWTCVGRGVAEGIDDAFDALTFGTPWSAPLQLDVLSDFQRVQGRISSPRSRHPHITYTAQFPEAAAGGTLRLVLRQAVGCRRLKSRTYTYKYKPAGTSTARFDGKGATVTVRRPRTNRFSAIRWYVGTLSFGGTRFITKSVDPSPSLLKVTARGVLSFVPPSVFPPCQGVAG